MGLNRRENHLVARLDADQERNERRSRYRDRALDLIGGAMSEVIDPIDRKEFARELSTATARNEAQACGPTAGATHLSSLAGQAFAAAEQLMTRQKRRARC